MKATTLSPRLYEGNLIVQSSVTSRTQELGTMQTLLILLHDAGTLEVVANAYDREDRNSRTGRSLISITGFLRAKLEGTVTILFHRIKNL